MNTKELLDLLVCPSCLGKLTALPDSEHVEGFACKACNRVYPVRENIPVMLVEESISREAWDRGVRQRSGN